MDIRTFLGAVEDGNGKFTFVLPTPMHGAFGGAFGGIIGACSIHAARAVAPGRVPIGIDCRFVRGLPAGSARAVASLLHGGRSLSTVSVDVTDERGRLATRASVSLVEPSALRDLSHFDAQRPGDFSPYDDARPWPAVAPIVETLGARSVGSGDGGFATSIRVPWDVAGASAESACLAADLSVGMPIGATLTAAGEPVPRAPNPDLTVRFCGEVDDQHIVGRARTVSMVRGVMAIQIDVWSGSSVVAVGSASAIVLPGT